MPDPPSLEMILQTALEIPGPEERARYLGEACRGDRALLKEAESLVAAHFADEGFMEPAARHLWDDARTERQGDTIGPFKLVRQLGEGGFGTVYLAEQSSPVRRQVALKLIKPGMDSREIIARFEAERQALAMMDHPHIAKVYDAGTTAGGRPYFVMELVEGVPITEFRAGADLGIAGMLGLFADVCAAVQHAHQKGIIHRDLKPANILVSVHDGEPVVKVIDFGIAKAIGNEASGITLFTQMGRMIGTPQYMSPEQAELHPLAVDTRSDIYSLGVVLYELLTGTTPLDPERLRGVPYGEIRRLIHEVIPLKPSTRISDFPAGHPADGGSGVSPRALRGDLDWIVLKALEKDPERRYESAGALAEDLLRYLQHKPVEARPPSMAYLMQRFARRHRGPVVAGGALLAALLLGAAGTSIGMKRALDAKEQLLWKNRELDRQKLELVDHKERLADLLESNQRMLGEIQRMSTNEAQLPAEFEALRTENQALLDKVSSETANQERHAEEISRLQRANAQLEKLVMESKDADAAVEWARARLFENRTVALQMNARGQFYRDGLLIPYPVLLQAFASRPDDDAGGKSPPRRLTVALPAGAKPTDAVFHSRLNQLAAAADRIGLRHDLPRPREKSLMEEKSALQEKPFSKEKPLPLEKSFSKEKPVAK